MSWWSICCSPGVIPRAKRPTPSWLLSTGRHWLQPYTNPAIKDFFWIALISAPCLNIKYETKWLAFCWGNFHIDHIVWKFYTSIKISLKFVPCEDPIYNKSSLIQNGFSDIIHRINKTSFNKNALRVQKILLQNSFCIGVPSWWGRKPSSMIMDGLFRIM